MLSANVGYCYYNHNTVVTFSAIGKSATEYLPKKKVLLAPNTLLRGTTRGLGCTWCGFPSIEVLGEEQNPSLLAFSEVRP